MRRKTLLTAALIGCLLALGVVPFAGDVKAQAENDTPPPASVAIVYDTSTLTGEKGRGKSFSRKKELFAALADYVRRANPRTEIFVIRFDETFRLTLNGTNNTEAILKALSELAASPQEGATALYDACLFAINTVARGRHDRRAIILLSDGVDTLSSRDLPDVTEALADKKIAVYAVNIQTPDVKFFPQSYREGNYVLERLASVSNGKLFQLEKGKERITFFETIENDLNAHRAEKSQ
jgi:Ca-activated chloride channel family protein